MDAQKVDMFLAANSKYFPAGQVMVIREILLNTDESRWAYIQSTSFNDPTMMLIVSLIGGGLGIDRFIIGDVGLGIGKLITCGGFGLWTIIDWFLIMDATREKNMQKLLRWL